MSNAPKKRNDPISPDADWILLALAEEPMHGGAISRQIIGDTMGAYIPDTSLYRLLHEMHADGYIENIGQSKVFRLTGKGRQRVLQQGGMWERAGRLVRQRLR